MLYKLKKNIKLETKRLFLKPVWFTDPKDLAKKANDFEAAKFIGRYFPYPYKLKDAINFIEVTKNNWNKKNKEWAFAIFLKKTNEFIGCIGIKPLEENKIIQNLGYWINEKYRSNGYAVEATKILCDLSFKELKVRKIESSVFSPNKASQRVLIKSGFKIEGIIRETDIMRDGEIVDEILFGKLKNE